VDKGLVGLGLFGGHAAELAEKFWGDTDGDELFGVAGGGAADATDYRSARNWSTVISAARIRARSVPVESSLCWGIDRFARKPDLVITTWLPTWPMTCQPALAKALTASLPEILASHAMRSRGGQHQTATTTGVPLDPIALTAF
jgi:hypothetical protein